MKLNYEEAKQKVKELGFDILPDYVDIAWFRVDEDGDYILEEIHKKVKDEGATVYGMSSEVEITLVNDVYLLKVRSSRNNGVLATKELESYEDVIYFLLIQFKGQEGIHDFGRLKQETK